MQIILTNVGKRYNRDWIFRKLSYTFSSGTKYAITGPNGSGKSTLLQVLSSAFLHNEGNIHYKLLDSGQQLQSETIYKHISVVAPYLELIEEMSATEFLSFHAQFKELTLPIDEIIEIAGLKDNSAKHIRNYSSGMKQRLKLVQGFFSNTPVLLLDEPTTNLDSNGIALYVELIEKYAKEKLVIISSNDSQEYEFCEQVIDITNYKVF